MASSSTSSSVHKSFKYDVFLSFRGEDTRTNFVDHLYYALQQKNIQTYKDDDRIRKGGKISDELMKSIEESKFYIIVFSTNYASSSWCLDELVKIIECQRTNEHTAYPVFYDVEPSEVRNQTGAVAEAFTKHENEEAAGKWRDALKEASDLAGWELMKTADRHEAKFIQKIVEELSVELRSTRFSIDEKLIGMETRINDVVSSFATGWDDVHMIGIKGMGGGGKTTLARAIFDRLSFEFEGKSFVENVREVSMASLFGLKSLQNQVLSDVFNGENFSVRSVYDGKHMIKKMMPKRKVLVVLDDVDHIDQLEALAGEANWFKIGSKIIITTRDEQVLIAHRVKLIHDVSLLSHKEAICLFSRHAFGREIPIQGYEELSRQVVCYAAGLPLTIRVLGSFLCGKNELEWIDAIARLKTIPLSETLKKLELSYIALEDDYKEMFLDVACILKGWWKDDAIKALESCGFHARNGLRVLEQKSLITVGNSNYGYVGMHDHIEEMGRNIVRRSHPDKPHKHSRLWNYAEIEDILANGSGTKATRCIRFNIKNTDQNIVLKGFRKMKELKFLSMVHGYQYQSVQDAPIPYQLSYTPEANGYHYHHSNIANPEFPNALRYLCLTNYPFTSLPKRFQANNLVTLELVGSKIEKLWEGGERKVLSKLRFLDMRNSMLSTLDLGLTPNLETLNLEKCHGLVELHISVVCLKLISVDLTFSRLRTLDLGLAPNLETLILAQCCDLVELHMPGRFLHLRSMVLTNSKLRTLDIGLIPNLKKLDLRNSYYLEELHMHNEYQKLANLNISHSKLRTFDIGLFPNLEELDLTNCYHLEELHLCNEHQKLAILNISHSKLKTLNLGLTPNLKRLHLKECRNLVALHTPIGCLKKLAHLVVSGCLGFSSFLFNLKDDTSCSAVDDLFEVSPLAELHLIAKSLENCPLHPDSSLPKFQFICSYEEDRPSLTGNLEVLLSVGMCACTNLERFSGNISGLRRLKKLKLEGNILEILKDLDQSMKVDELIVSSAMFEHLPDSTWMLKHLKSLGVDRCVWLEKLPDYPVQLDCLQKLELSYTKIKHLPDSFLLLKHLKSLKLRFCCFLEKLPKDLGRLECLEYLTLSSTMIRYLPDSIVMLKHLKSLQLIYCSLLEKLPEDLGRLERLEKIFLNKCDLLQAIPNSIGKMKCLKYLHIPYCIRVEKFPAGSFECLKELNIEGTSISHLPQSIFLLKDLHITGSRGVAQLWDFTPETQTPECKTSYVRVHSDGTILRISEGPEKTIPKEVLQ